jgi:hypothetical protein
MAIVEIHVIQSYMRMKPTGECPRIHLKCLPKDMYEINCQIRHVHHEGRHRVQLNRWTHDPWIVIQVMLLDLNCSRTQRVWFTRFTIIQSSLQLVMPLKSSQIRKHSSMESGTIEDISSHTLSAECNKAQTFLSGKRVDCFLSRRPSDCCLSLISLSLSVIHLAFASPPPFLFHPL